jgi:hypothetical protein
MLRHAPSPLPGLAMLPGKKGLGGFSEAFDEYKKGKTVA